MLRFALFALPFTVLVACNSEKADGGDDTAGGGGDDTGGGGSSGGGSGGGDGGGGSTGCPDEVPEDFTYVWDCDASGCDDGVVMYHYAVGSSSGGDPVTIEMTEKYFIFYDTGDWCVDDFAISGEYSAYDPTTFGCSECEEIYQVSLDMSSSNNCGMMWGSLINGDKEVEGGPFDGFLMFDTHNELNDERNEDNKMLVVATLYNEDEGGYARDSDYGMGYANPTTSVDGPPQDYEWYNSGECLRTSRMTGGDQPVLVRTPDLTDRVLQALGL